MPELNNWQRGKNYIQTEQLLKAIYYAFEENKMLNYIMFGFTTLQVMNEIAL